MFKVINCGKMPTRATKYSVCVDLYANADVVINAGDTAIIHLGVCIDENYLLDKFTQHLTATSSQVKRFDAVRQYDLFLNGHYLQLEPRSSLRAKGLQAGTGIIDLDFKDEICLILSNPIVDVIQFQDGIVKQVGVNGLMDFKISKGDRIAQIMLCEHKSYLFGIESEEERNGGMGSTDERD